MQFSLSRRDVSHWDVGTHGWAVEPGALQVSVGSSSRDLPLTATVRLDAPALCLPLTEHSTIGEWMEHPEAGPALLEAMGEFGALFGPRSPDPATAALLTAMPVVKVPLMGMSDAIALDDLNQLVERYGAHSR